MPASDLPPAPIIPEESTYYASAGTMAPASGLQTALSGPWMIESQDLTIAYTRVPTGWMQSYPNITLSGCSSIPAYPTWVHNDTRLNCIIKATCSKVKSYDTYSVATFQQPQKFTIYATAWDANGVTYGDLNASGLGPRGTIVTTQPYLSRREWNDSVDSEYVSSVQLANFSFITSDCGNLTSQSQLLPQPNSFIVNYIEPPHPATLLSQGNSYVERYYPDYQIPGTYSTKKEVLGQTLTFITAVGAALRYMNLPAIPAVWGKSPFGNDMILRDQGLPEYNQWRHDYS